MCFNVKFMVTMKQKFRVSKHKKEWGWSKCRGKPPVYKGGIGEYTNYGNTKQPNSQRKNGVVSPYITIIILSANEFNL